MTKLEIDFNAMNSMTILYSVRLINMLNHIRIYDMQHYVF